ncbi:P-loop containing nucleoside triphosphate hydrolase protein [Meira miltonrushii]|uniref:P-loop containing nucleoside triphosphate hydrolase protein n=1 Tax=Meira miltonrushii TaxID=1280837 RepID=A0A316VNW9_9BASI|nr:P-loop containing nucleoside triphosphate hydrolase protein [Meira miltonrushii]PWN37215.1 P-loop containing nucleoside triphosphate hydrolase protein [Meira miltonrushii]
MPRRSAGPPKPRKIPNVANIVAVSSAKGGVGKSTVSANLALSLARNKVDQGRSVKVGLLDLDIFGPSIPLLMGLEGQGEPDLTENGALLPLKNHGIPCMSMGFLLPPSPDGTSSSAPVVWRGLMVMKAVQQLLFDVDWRGDAGEGLDVLVIDMPPGTGDVALTLSQLVKVDGAVIVSTPQEVALADARKGVAMFDKVNVPILGMVLNMAHFTAPDTGKTYPLFGSPKAFDAFAQSNNVSVLGRLPLEPIISSDGDAGTPIVLRDPPSGSVGHESSNIFKELGSKVWQDLSQRQSGKTRE